jgi:hypothetical protein
MFSLPHTSLSKLQKVCGWRTVHPTVHPTLLDEQCVRVHKAAVHASS